MTMPRQPETPDPKTTTATKRVHKASTKAAAIFDRLGLLDKAEAQELANAPASIADRYKEKRAKLYEGLSGETLDLVKRFRGADAPEFAEEGPVSE